jgi:O-antigen/teichoic acid export membrane protein
LYLLFRLEERVDFKIDKFLWKQLWSLGWMAQLANIIQFVNYRISYYYLMNSSTGGTADLGKYSIAVSIAESVWIIGQSLATVQFSKLSNIENSAERKKISLRLFKLNFMLNGLAVLTLLFTPSFIYVWIFGAGFDVVSRYIFWMALGIFSLGVATSMSAYFSGRGMYKHVIYASLWGVLFTVLICHSFIPTYGVQAAAWATTVSYTALCTYFLIVFLKTEQVSITKLLPGYSDFNLYRRWLKTVI